MPRSIAVCGAKKYRGEPRSVATRRGVKNTYNGSNRVNPPLPLCSYKEYRGSARRAKGLEYKQDPPIPPLSGGEVARETEEKWARTVRAKRVPQTPTATVATSQKPDNRGGASWFVLLAAEKNEQIKRISVTRTFFGWERKFFVSQSSLAVSRMRGIALQ